MSRDLFDYQFELALKEMELLQNSISRFSAISMTVKGWAITVVSGLLVLGVQRESYSLLVVSPIAVVLFWLLDATFRRMERVFTFRYNKIENELRMHLKSSVKNGMLSFEVPNTFSRANVEGARARYPFLKDTLSWDIAIPYVAMLMISILMSVLLGPIEQLVDVLRVVAK